MFINYDQETKRVNYYVFDESVLDKTELEKGIIVSNLEVPIPDTLIGKHPELKFNPTDNSFYYEYVDRPLTDQEKINQLETDVATANYALMMGGLI